MFNWFTKNNKDGLEIPDPTPIEVTLRDKPLSLNEQIMRFTSNEMHMAALRNKGIDTFDEADDFDTGDLDGPDFNSPYEDQFEPSEIGLNRVQTRLDEQKSGMVEEIPIDRSDRAKDNLRRLNEPKPKAAESPDPKLSAKINA